MVIEQQSAVGTQVLLIVPMKSTGVLRGTVHGFGGTHRVERTGRYSHGMRVRARAPGQEVALRGLVLWA